MPGGLVGNQEPAYRIVSPYPKKLSLLLSALPFLVTFTHVLVSPYTKVEESFTLHAVHDVYAHGADYKLWDYVQFPGAVPRSFVPSLLIALMNWPMVKLFTALGIVKTKLGVQILIRLGLCVHHCTQFNELRNTIAIRYGTSTGIWFVLLSMTQFHVPYYAGRTLQNFIALPFVYSALAMIIHTLPHRNPTPAEKTRLPPQRKRSRLLRNAIVQLVQVACILRAEESMFVIPLALSLYFRGRMSLFGGIFAGLEGMFPIAVIGWLDYALWSQALPHPSLPSFSFSPTSSYLSRWKIFWPELGAMYYNAIEGNAAKWGVEPWDYYLRNSLPKLLMTSVLLVPFGTAWMWAGKVGVTVLPVEMMHALGEVGDEWVWGAVGLLGSMSLLGHKEWRFIVYVVPVFNTLAAIVAQAMWSSSPPRLRPLFRLAAIGCLALNTCATVGMTYISSLNYPGGQVWEVLEELQAGSGETVKIHFSPYPLSTGASLFTFLHSSPSLSSTDNTTWTTVLHTPPGPAWVYSKSEDPALITPQGASQAGMDYVVLGAEELPAGGWLGDAGKEYGWEVRRRIEGYDGLKRKGWRVGVGMGDKVVVLGRKSTLLVG